MTENLKPIQIRGNQKIVKILDDGFSGFRKVVHQVCNQRDLIDTILGWGSEKTYLSIFSHGLNKYNRYCFLEWSVSRAAKNTEGSKEGPGRLDAYLVDYSMKSKLLIAEIEAKAVDPSIKEKASEFTIRQPIEALKEAKEQLESLGRDPEDIYCDEYRIALIFTVARVKFAVSGKGENLNWNDYEVIRSRAKDCFSTVKNKIKGKNIRHYEYIHSIPQLQWIREYNGTVMEKEGNEVERPHGYTYYPVGVLVTAAIFR